MDLVVNHTSDEHPWFVESRSSTDNPKRDWYWWRPPERGCRRRPGAEPQLALRLLRLGLGAGRDDRRVLPAPVLAASSPTSTGRTREVRQAVHRMMRWWLDQGVDGFRMDVIDHISKDPALPDGVVAAGEATPGRGARPRAGRGSTSSSPRCTPRSSPAGTPILLVVGEMPGVTIDDAVLFTDPARREVDMVFQFEHVGLDHGPTKWDAFPLDLRDLRRRSGAGRTALAERGWNSLYWNNHDQPRVVSRFGDDGAWRVRSATCLGTLLHLHRGTPYVYQGEELGHDERAVRVPRRLPPTSSRCARTTNGSAAGARPGRRARPAACPQPGQRPHPDAVGRLTARRLQHRRAVARRSTRTTSRSTPGSARRPGARSSTTTGG